MRIAPHVIRDERPPHGTHPAGEVRIVAFTNGTKKKDRWYGHYREWAHVAPAPPEWERRVTAEAIAYVEQVLADPPVVVTTPSGRRGLLSEKQLDALRTSADRPKYTRAEPDLPWQECEEIVERDLQDTYPEAFIFPAKNIPGFGSDLGVAFPDGSYHFVEVKKAHTTVTRNERDRAIEKGAGYVLAIVSKDRSIEYIDNPAGKGTFEEVVSVSYRWRPNA